MKWSDNVNGHNLPRTSNMECHMGCFRTDNRPELGITIKGRKIPSPNSPLYVGQF